MTYRASPNAPPHPNMVALFAGGGGLHRGFFDEGYFSVLASDIESTSADTFAHNFPEVPFHCGDIRHLTPAHAKRLVRRSDIDVIVGGPPCQGFSTLGDQIHADPRNSLSEAFGRFVSWLRPSCVLMENTSYLRSQYAGRYETEIRSLFSIHGYRVFVQVLNAADFGTPQIRKRLFFFATRLPNGFHWPVPTHGPIEGINVRRYRTVGDSILDLVKAPPDYPGHIPLRHGDTVIARYRLIPEGGRLPPPQELPAHIRRRNFGNTYKRLHRNRPSLTLVPGNNAFPVHPVLDRSLTPREAARLQDFPDEHWFAGNRSQQCKLVGNAVPVCLARALARSISLHLSGATPTQITVRPSQLSLPEVIHTSLTSRRSSRRAVSFFTGLGGLLLGFERAGFDTLASFDRKNIVERNLAANFPDVPHHRRDVSDMSAHEVLELTGANLDVVYGGSPCQGFSIFGKRRFVNTRGHQPSKDERNELTIKFVDLVVRLSPRLLLLENVRGLLNTPRGRTTYLREIERRLKRGGYEVEHRVINSADYGVPQLRHRLILIATRDGLAFDWPLQKYHAEPKPWQRPYVTVGDVISDLSDADTYDAAFNHVPMSHKELVVERYKLIPEGGRLPEAALPTRLRRGYRTEHVKNFSHVYRRLSRYRPATTMVPGHNAFPVHPTLPRALTVREAARIQTFPDAIRLVGTRQQQCLLVGNAVPPTLAETFAQAIAASLDGRTLHPGYKMDHYELKARA